MIRTDRRRTLEQVRDDNATSGVGATADLFGTIVGVVALHTGDRALAQESLVRLCARGDRVTNPRAWAIRVALNISTSVIRRRLLELRAIRRGPVAQFAPEADTDLALDVRRALRALPARQREASLLRYLADLSPDDVATVMQCAPGTAKAHIARGLAALRANPIFEIACNNADDTDREV